MHIINSSLIDMELADTDRLKCYGVPCTRSPTSWGTPAWPTWSPSAHFVQATGIISLDAVIGSLENVISVRYHKLIPANTEAIKAGAKHVS